jgi:hypothetical protein
VNQRGPTQRIQEQEREHIKSHARESKQEENVAYAHAFTRSVVTLVTLLRSGMRTTRAYQRTDTASAEKMPSTAPSAKCEAATCGWRQCRRMPSQLLTLNRISR